MLYQKGRALSCLSKYDDVLACYDKVLEISPEHACTLLNKGSLLLKLEKYNETQVVMKK